MTSSSSIDAPAGEHRGLADVRCPLCDQPIPHEQFDEIHGRIQARERQQREAVEDRVRHEVERARLAAEEEARAALAEAQAEASAERERLEQAFTAREAAAIEESRKAALAEAAETLGAAERARDAAQAELETLKAQQAGELTARLQEQREALDIEHQKALNAERAKAFEDRQKVEEKVEQLQRELQRKRADELGEGAEVDLFETLRREFPDDKITRVKKGEAGADVLHRVMDGADECGLIVYDSKNRNAWRNDYVSKLREDQIAAKADIAILTSRAFPSGARQLHVQDGIIVANPARALALVTILRRHIVQIHGLRLSNEARDDKMSHLYDFVTSERFAVLLEQIETLTSDLLDLDVKEQTAHSRTWHRRGGLVRSIQRVHGDLTMELDRIVGKDTSSGLAVL